MKKLLIALFTSFIVQIVTAQTFNTVNIGDEVYAILSAAESKGLCSTLQNAKPFTEKYIIDRLDEIIENAGETSTEGKAAEFQKKRFLKNEKGWNWKKMAFTATNDSEKAPISFIVSDGVDSAIYGGLYNDSGKNAFAYEVWNKLSFRGDLGKNVSYYAMGFIGFVRSPLEEVGDYKIGAWWYEKDTSKFINYDSTKSNAENLINPNTWNRKIKTFRNNVAMPYSYKQYWDGPIFNVSHFDNAGMEGWPTGNSIGYGMYGEITASFLENRVQLGVGRYDREYAAMDTDSSLVLNSRARPFFGVDMNFNILKWISFSTSGGTLEYPNQDFVLQAYDDEENAWKRKGENDEKTKDSYYFQNMFAIAMLNLDFKYFHFDMGSSCVFPKRTDFAYAFPLIDRLMTQDSLGDFDNLALFCDFKGKIPKYGSIWLSLYLDEKENPRPSMRLFEKTRNMFSYQIGAKANLPSKIFPFGTVSFRYTKIEPYCYTHHAINYTPWYNHYISESYTNNGSCLGYYMPPNSDEFLLRLDTRPLPALAVGGQFQLTRHGADFGNHAVPGSSLYSEMPPDGRDELNKYFLQDGAYEWIIGISCGASYDLNAHGIPVRLSASVGFIHSWWTDISDDDYDNKKKGSYEKVDTDEYSGKTGVVMSLSVKIFGR